MFLQGKLVTVLSSKHYVFLYHNTLRHILVSAKLSDNRRDNLKFCNSVHLSRFFKRRPHTFLEQNYKDDFSQPVIIGKGEGKTLPVQGLDRPSGFQQFGAPDFMTIGT